jgi:hypothetical protein
VSRAETPDEGDRAAVGLTTAGITQVTREHCELNFEVRAAGAVKDSRENLVRIVEYLQEHGETHRREFLDAVYEPTGPGGNSPKHGTYTRLNYDGWFADVGEPALRRLPVIEGDDDGDVWRFSGIDADEHDDEHVVSLAKLRGDVDQVTENALDALGVARGADEREALRRFARRIRQDAPVSTGDLGADEETGLAASDVADDLEQLPGIRHTVEEPPDPEELPVETMADVLEGYEALEAGPTEVWQYREMNGLG